jgi:hypothetical protein
METKKRFIEYITKEPNRFLPYAFEQNPRIKNFEDLENAFRDAFPTQNENITSYELIELWETEECKKRVGDNTTKKEYEDVYGDGHEVIYTAKKEEIIKIEIPKIQSKGYAGKTKAIAQYSRTKPRKFTPVEAKFLQARKMKKLSPKQVTAQYNLHFTQRPRTYASIKTKMQRTKTYGI